MNEIELNTRYGAPGRIIFRKGHCGYPEVAIACKYGSAEIALLGANVLSYKPTGHVPVLFRSAKRDYARGESVHGGMPLCWPQFGKLAIDGMAAHGFAKIMLFRVKSTRYSDEMTEITLALESSPDTRKLWPHDFRLEFTVTVSSKLNLKLETFNTGDAPFEFTAGFHPYFLVRDRNATAVKGLDGLEYVFAEDMTRGRQDGDLAVDRALDHVFELPEAPKHEFALVDPGLRRAIAVASHGARRAVVWNPGPAAGLPDLAPDDWRSFVCFEPVTDWPKAGNVLEPDESSVLLAAIQSTME